MGRKSGRNPRQVQTIILTRASEVANSVPGQSFLIDIQID